MSEVIPYEVEVAVGAILEEHSRATRKWPRMRSPMEGLAILQEEVDELQAEVRAASNSTTPQMREEAVQVAAMALRFILDVCKK